MDWKIELHTGQIEVNDIVDLMTKHFPQRKRDFFIGAVQTLNDDFSRLYLLVRGGKLAGAFFGYKIYGYDQEVWSPSYLCVDEESRDVSLMFIMAAFRKMSKCTIDVSPSIEVKNILSALKYKEINEGSLLFPLLQGVIKDLLKKEDFLKRCIAPVSRFQNRDDLLWFQNDASSLKGDYICVKASSRYSISVYLLVYYNLDTLPGIFPRLITTLSKLNPLGLFIVPNNGHSLSGFSLKSGKFHSFSNFKQLGDIYSVLGSEVSEII